MIILSPLRYESGKAERMLRRRHLYHPLAPPKEGGDNTARDTTGKAFVPLLPFYSLLIPFIPFLKPF